MTPREERAQRNLAKALAVAITAFPGRGQDRGVLVADRGGPGRRRDAQRTRDRARAQAVSDRVLRMLAELKAARPSSTVKLEPSFGDGVCKAASRPRSNDANIVRETFHTGWRQVGAIV